MIIYDLARMSTAAELLGVTVTPVARPTSERVLHIGTRTVPVHGPSLRDPRLHLSAVVATVLVLGITWMDFEISVAQILLSVAVCGTLEAALTLRRCGALIWPASAMQTATSTVLILRVTGWNRDSLWSLDHWYLYVGVSVAGVLSKHLIRVHGRHVFNPSNVALVAAFVVIGSDRIEPLVLWWAPLRAPMVIAYAAIIVGGVIIDRRLRLLEMAAVCWLVLAAGIGLLGLQGHTITTSWSFAPVSGGHFWVTVMTSPETLLFCFFMVTDPKTVPAARHARVRFAAVVGAVSALLAAPWGTEFGTKVGVLGGLVVGSIVRLFSERRSTNTLRPERRRTALHFVVPAAAFTLVGATIVALGSSSVAVTTARPAIAVARPGDIAFIPVPTIDREVAGVSARLATPDGARELGATLARNLEIEAEALDQGNASILEAVDHGDRLADQQVRIRAARAAGTRTIATYRFDTLHLSVVFPGGAQSGANAGLTVTGSVTESVIDSSGRIVHTSERPLDTTFAMREVQPGRWFITNELPPTGAHS